LAVTALALLGIDSIAPETKNNAVLAGTSVVGSFVALAFCAWYLAAGTGQPSTDGAIVLYEEALVVDGAYLFFSAIFASVAAMVAVASYDYLAGRDYQGEFYSLTMMAATGMTLMAASNSLATAFVALELSSLPSYALVAFLKKNRGSVEAGLKYFLIGALSSAVFVFGISLIFAVTGSLVFGDVAEALGGTDLVGVAGVGVLMV
ncbi:proton-conducting transporter membrane subunit, partial [Halobium palmae]